MKATNDFDITGSNRFIKVTELGDPHIDELTIKISYEGESSVLHAIPLDNIIIPKILAALNPPSIIEKPLTIDQVRERMDSDGYITGIVRANKNDLIDNDLEEFLDDVSESLVGGILEDISYEFVGVDKGDVLVEVTGNAMIHCALSP